MAASYGLRRLNDSNIEAYPIRPSRSNVSRGPWLYWNAASSIFTICRRTRTIFGPKDRGSKEGFRTVLAVPLLRKDDFIGVM